MKNSCGFATKAIHAGAKRDTQFGALATPIYSTSTFEFDSAEQGGARFRGDEQGYIYSRLGNPTTAVLEEKLAALEGAEAALAVASGIAAVDTIFWTAVRTGDHVVADETLYGCTFAYLNHGLSRFGVETTFVDTSCVENMVRALRPETKVLYLETPANPTLKVVDLAALAKAAHDYNPNILVVVDNTFATPYLQRPIELSCDVVLHSATKYLNGHGDVIAGMIAGKADFLSQCRLFGLKDMTGAVIGAFESYLIIRGMKTLPLRVAKHCENAQKVAEFLAKHPKVEAVYYPGLAAHPGHEIAKKQMHGGFGAVIAFEVTGGFEPGKKLINSVELAKVAVSLGDCETLIEHPASMTHSPYTPEERREAGISEGLIRLAVGLEDAEDIIADLAQALDKI
ncbi:MAG: methionine gamma-lyase [Clostridia bacterium]|nr:methionine gamma-lyase [Clostridia bacterium]